MKILILSTFLSLMLGKLTSIYEKLFNIDINSFFGSILYEIKLFLESIGIDKVSTFEIVNLGQGFEGTSHLLNYLICYTPTFGFILFLFAKPDLVISYISFIYSKFKTPKVENGY